MAAAAGAGERRGAWGAAGPERGPGPGPGPLGSLLSRLPLAPSPRRRTASQCKPEPPLLRTSKRTIYTAGRPPWYSETGAPVDEAFVIGERRAAAWAGAGAGEGMEPGPGKRRGRALSRSRGSVGTGAGAGSGAGE